MPVRAGERRGGPGPVQVDPALMVGRAGKLRGTPRASRLFCTEGRGQEVSEDVRKAKSSLKCRASSPHTVCRTVSGRIRQETGI